MRITLSIAASVLFSAIPCFGWGQDGHKAVARLAQSLANPTTVTKVNNMLGVSHFEDVATWADDVRSASRHQGPLSDSSTPQGQEAHRINLDFPNNGNWHFVDLPHGLSGYDDTRAAAFEGNDDIVHAINRNIDVLEGHPAASDASITKQEALRFLIHFVGDIHQPLHCSDQWYTEDGNENAHAVSIPTPPTNGLLEDRGGNQLFFTQTKELHAFWDTTLVKDIENGNSDFEEAVADAVDPSWTTPAGDVHTWASTWATESFKLGVQAYQGISFGKVVPQPAPKQPKIMIRLPGNYENDEDPIAQTQLAKAGFRLAKLLDAIMPTVTP